MKLPTIRQVTFEITVEPEHIPVRGNAMASGDAATDKRIEDRIIRDSDWNEWAWCMVRVTASFNGFEGDACLGCCSYASERGFRRDGYWPDMKREAFDALLVTMRSAAERLGCNEATL